MFADKLPHMQSRRRPAQCTPEGNPVGHDRHRHGPARSTRPPEPEGQTEDGQRETPPGTGSVLRIPAGGGSKSSHCKNMAGWLEVNDFGSKRQSRLISTVVLIFAPSSFDQQPSSASRLGRPIQSAFGGEDASHCLTLTCPVNLRFADPTIPSTPDSGLTSRAGTANLFAIRHLTLRVASWLH